MDAVRTVRLALSTAHPRRTKEASVMAAVIMRSPLPVARVCKV